MKLKKNLWLRLTSHSVETDTNTQRKMIGLSHNALGVIAQMGRGYCEVLLWLRMAEREKARFGGRRVADNSANRRRLEEKAAKSDAP